MVMMKMDGDLVIVSLCSSNLIQFLQSEYFIAPTVASNTSRLNYLAVDSKVSGCAGAPFQVSTEASTFGIFLVTNQNSPSCGRPHYSYQNVK